MGLHHCLSPRKRNIMSVMIFSTNILLIHGKKCGILKKTAKYSKITAKNHVFLSETPENMGLHHCLFPQKHNFMSEMIVSINILLINGKKCGILQKQQKTTKNHVFFVLICRKYGFASFSFPITYVYVINNCFYQCFANKW